MGILLARCVGHRVSSHAMRLFLAAAALLRAGAVSAQTAPPKLVVFLSIDQGRAEYLERFRPALDGGLLFLLERGVIFTETHHAHANTVTAPGDWMKGRSRASKVYAASGKDRSAVLMGGKKPDGAFWFDGESGQWVTSRYYMNEYPAWVRQFHERRLADGFFGRWWEPLPVSEALLSSMKIEASGAGAAGSGVPKILGRRPLSEDAGFYHALFATPFLESYTLTFAESLVREEGLGADDATDFLALGFSSVDSVGHDYGPNSRELLDAVLRLDRELGAFFRFLDRTIGLAGVAVALSADHGVAPLPEYQARHGLSSGRVSTSDLACLARAGKPGWFVAPLHFDDKALAKENVKREAAEGLVAEELSACPR